jgi:hypothetical protein
MPYTFRRLISQSYQITIFLCRLSEQALSAGFVDPSDYCKIWLAYIDFLRRRLIEDDKEQFAKGLLI